MGLFSVVKGAVGAAKGVGYGTIGSIGRNVPGAIAGGVKRRVSATPPPDDTSAAAAILKKKRKASPPEAGGAYGTIGAVGTIIGRMRR